MSASLPDRTTAAGSGESSAGLQGGNFVSERLLWMFAAHTADRVYSDLPEARRLLLKFAERLESDPYPDSILRIGELQMKGNLSNQEHNYEEALDYLNQAYLLAEEEASHEVRVEVAADLLGPLLNLDRLLEAAELLDLTHQHVARQPTSRDWWLLTREGFLHLKWSSLDEALRSFTLAKSLRPTLTPIANTVKEAYYAALLDAGLGRVYGLGQELNRSIEAYERVIARCQVFGMHGRLAYHTLDLGRALMAANRRSEAEARFHETIALAGPRDKHAIASALANLGYYAMVDGEWEATARRFEEAEHNYRTSDQPSEGDLSMIYLWRARVERERGNHRGARAAFIDSFDLASSGGDRAQLAIVCAEVAEFHAEQREFEEAYEFRLLYEQIQSEVREAASAQRLSELELRHEVEQRRQEGEVLKLGKARLQLKALRAQMNPHFIFNALNSIQEFITSQQSTEAATHLAHFARLMRQILDYSEREMITLEEEVDFLRNYLNLNRSLRFKDVFDYEIVVDQELEDDLIGLPAMLVQPYVENALEHGVRLVPDGFIRITFSSPIEDDSQLVIEIEDNGQGRERAIASQGELEQAHRSMGTAITRHRLELLNQSQATEAAVVYEDLTHGDGTSAGTRVRISMPVHWLS